MIRKRLKILLAISDIVFEIFPRENESTNEKEEGRKKGEGSSKQRRVREYLTNLLTDSKVNCLIPSYSPFTCASTPSLHLAPLKSLAVANPASKYKGLWSKRYQGRLIQ
ncbi:hypothetical protein AVEN_213902-1 [Araneus ventricosus]|uniref:Uncharacterized protein n=1 Tax=Araneus ventricosus TaxID=182803 RepID=A0A4Y2NLK8_ARAVE|nr:hypothetical protein AVEN_213902-1 [Araneus ventricosus]